MYARGIVKLLAPVDLKFNVLIPYLPSAPFFWPAFLLNWDKFDDYLHMHYDAVTSSQTTLGLITGCQYHLRETGVD